MITGPYAVAFMSPFIAFIHSNSTKLTRPSALISVHFTNFYQTQLPYVDSPCDEKEKWQLVVWETIPDLFMKGQEAGGWSQAVHLVQL